MDNNDSNTSKFVNSEINDNERIAEIDCIKKNLDNFILTQNDELLRPYGDFLFEDLKELLNKLPHLTHIFSALLWNDLHCPDE